MLAIEAKWIFVVLGPIFLVLGAARWALAGNVVPQAKTWLIIGVVFSAVAILLWLQDAGP